LRDWATLDVGNWRLRGSKQEETGQAHTLDWLREDARLECADVGGDVGVSGMLMSLQVAGAILQIFSIAMDEVLAV